MTALNKPLPLTAKFTKRIGVLLIVLAPILFVLSTLFLANELLYPPESFPSVLGTFLGLVISPFLLFLGIAVYIIAWRRQPKAEPEGKVFQEQLGQQEKAVKAKPKMPRWERWARWIYVLIILTWLIATTVIYFSYISHLPVIYLPLIFVMPLVACFCLRSSKRGWFGAIFILLISAITFFGVLPTVLMLLVGTPGIGFIDRYLDWAIGIDQAGGLVALLTVRAAIIFSAGIFLVVARLLQYQKIHHLSGKKIFKAVAIGAVLLPLLFMMVTSSGETNADPTIVPPTGVSWDNALGLVPDIFQTSRIFDQATGTWTYTIFFSNPNPENQAVTQVWAGRDAITPFNENVVINGSGVRISDEGIVFETSCNGTIQFSITQGHNTLTVKTDNGARYTFSWSEQL